MEIALDRDGFFVAGEWVRPRAGAGVNEVIEAATEKVFGRVALAGEADVDASVSAASEALSGPWATMPAVERAEVMRRIAAWMRARAKDTAALVSRENGMPRRLSLGANGFFPPSRWSITPGWPNRSMTRIGAQAPFPTSRSVASRSGWSPR